MKVNQTDGVQTNKIIFSAKTEYLDKDTGLFRLCSITGPLEYVKEGVLESISLKPKGTKMAIWMNGHLTSKGKKKKLRQFTERTCALLHQQRFHSPIPGIE